MTDDFPKLAEEINEKVASINWIDHYAQANLTADLTLETLDFGQITLILKMCEIKLGDYSGTIVKERSKEIFQDIIRLTSAKWHR